MWEETTSREGGQERVTTRPIWGEEEVVTLTPEAGEEEVTQVT